MADLFEAAGLTPSAPSPLADRLRPQKLDEVVGQDHLLGPEGPIRRMVEAIGYEVKRLKRIRIENIGLGKLEEGECAKLTPAERQELLERTVFANRKDF